jgi:hypothetical protein
MELFNEKDVEFFVCPRCDGLFEGYPALSRRDNKTKICSVCGSDEAMFDFNMSSWENIEEKKILIEKEKRWLSLLEN